MNIKKGFTLIELLVVIAIIAILATLVMVNYSGAQAKTRDAKRITDLSSISSAIVMFRADLQLEIRSGAYVTGSYVKRNPCNAYQSNNGNICPRGSFPSQGQGMCIVGVGQHPIAINALCLKELIDGGYMTSLPHDPSTTEQKIQNNDVSCEGSTSNQCYGYGDQTFGFPNAQLITKLERYNGPGMPGTYRRTSGADLLTCSSTSDNGYYCIKVPQ